MVRGVFSYNFIPIGLIKIISFISSYSYEGPVAVQQNGGEVKNYLFNGEGTFVLDTVTITAKFDNDKVSELYSIESEGTHYIVTSSNLA